MTGVSNEIILSNLALVAEKGVPVVIRVPLIPGYNNSDENLKALAEAVVRITKDAPVNILPYHRYGANKYPWSGWSSGWRNSGRLSRKSWIKRKQSLNPTA